MATSLTDRHTITVTPLHPVIGAEVARHLGYKVGDEIELEHGQEPAKATRHDHEHERKKPALGARYRADHTGIDRAGDYLRVAGRRTGGQRGNLHSAREPRCRNGADDPPRCGDAGLADGRGRRR